MRSSPSTHLDQAVRIEAGGNLLHDSLGQAGVADHDNWLEGVSMGTQFAALGRCKFKHDSFFECSFKSGILREWPRTN